MSTFAAVVYVVGGLAIIVGGFATIHAKVVSPFLAKPLAKALRHELREEVIEQIRSPEVTAVIQEAVAQETRPLLGLLRSMDQRLSVLERQGEQVVRATSKG